MNAACHYTLFDTRPACSHGALRRIRNFGDDSLISSFRAKLAAQAFPPAFGFVVDNGQREQQFKSGVKGV